ncbi:MAG: tRNA 2-thiouridine(34) synthase MnmA [Bacteroidales bacterium]|nr:tRNA 2-thiouridine(34) synthase MnmA [Bacteroidales bacterium]
MSHIKGKVLMAMSGGIDSSVAAMLLLEQGYELIGVTFRTYDSQLTSGCCSIDAVSEAAKLAAKLGIEHHVADFRQVFKEHVVCNFIDEYMHGRTPNPCVLCNSSIKWGFLWEQAQKLGCEYIATGHYARIKELNGHWYLATAADTLKDQTYFLWMLTEDNLKHTIFPLGDFTKTEVREMAAQRGFERLSKKEESQEICFIPDNDYRQFLAQHVSDFENRCQAGDFLDITGKKVGRHEGFPNYTIGQRKGLKVAFGVPKYVVHIDSEKNTVTLGDREDLEALQVRARQCKLTDRERISRNPHCLARIRYRSAATPANIQIEAAEGQDELSNIKLTFENPVWGVTPGQSLVLYQDGLVIGGGIIY